LQVTYRTVQRWRKSGRLPYSKIGGKYYYKADIILDSFKMKPDRQVSPVEVGPIEIGPVEVEFPPPVIENVASGDEMMVCKTCPLFLLLIS